MKMLNEFHSCYDELLSMLFSNNCDNQKAFDGKFISLFNDNQELTSLTAHEILVYSLLLNKCIEAKDEKQSISYTELQLLRNKRIGKSKALDNDTSNAYDNTFYGLCSKTIRYSLGDTRKRNKITYREKEQPLLILYDVSELGNGDKVINYSLGPFGKTLLESKRYSTLLPNKYFQVNFNEIMTYQVALYICRTIFMERRKKKDTITITLNSVMKNTNKFIYSADKKLVNYGSCLDYKGPNTKRLWLAITNNVNDILKQLRQEYKIKDFVEQPDANDNYQNAKWLLQLSK